MRDGEKDRNSWTEITQRRREKGRKLGMTKAERNY